MTATGWRDRYERWQRDRACTRKRPYHCQLDANQAVLDAARNGKRLTTYRCRFCQLIHLTTEHEEPV